MGTGKTTITADEPKDMTVGKMLSVVVASVEEGLGSLGPARAAAEQADLEKLKSLVQSANGAGDEAMVRSVLEPMVADINRSNIQRPVCLFEISLPRILLEGTGGCCFVPLFQSRGGWTKQPSSDPPVRGSLQHSSASADVRVLW